MFGGISTRMPGTRQRRLSSADFTTWTPLGGQARRLRTEVHMFQPISAYAVAVSAMLFAALSAISLITAVKHLEPPNVH